MGRGEGGGGVEGIARSAPNLPALLGSSPPKTLRFSLRCHAGHDTMHATACRLSLGHVKRFWTFDSDHGVGGNFSLAKF